MQQLTIPVGASYTIDKSKGIFFFFSKETFFFFSKETFKPKTEKESFKPKKSF